MLQGSFKKLKSLLRRESLSRSPRTDRQAVEQDILADIDMTFGYFLSLIIANLIALVGLITNSSPVIIGAMLISPLMSPILSVGFAFITGDKVIWQKSLKKLTISVVLVIIFSAIATYFSPLDDLTPEIVARTTPNLYDLIIAFLAGTAGAVAICTKKNYLTIVPGVAIATAVIPPLSVSGFGIGVGNPGVALGGFFLFFTNFVAIVISTCLIFYAYGFKPKVTGNIDRNIFRRRFIFLFIALFVISVPLMYTLQKTISEVRLRQRIQNTLKQSFDKTRLSRLSTFSYAAQKNGTIDIDAVINTVSYIKDSEIRIVESKLTRELGRGVALQVEQVRVQEGGLKEEKPISIVVPTVVPPKLPQDIIKDSREGAVTVTKKALEKVNEIISPSTIQNFKVGFNSSTMNISIALTIKRDAPLSQEELLWLKRVLSSSLNFPVDLAVETVPFVSPLVFEKGEVSLSEEMKDKLLSLKGLYGKDKNILLTIETRPEASLPYKKRIKIADERAAAVKDFLAKECDFPQPSIRAVMSKHASATPVVTVSIASRPLVPEIGKSPSGDRSKKNNMKSHG